MGVGGGFGINKIKTETKHKHPHTLFKHRPTDKPIKNRNTETHAKTPPVNEDVMVALIVVPPNVEVLQSTPRLHERLHD